MVHYRLDPQANRIFTESAADAESGPTSRDLKDLLPLTKPGFTMLIDMSELHPGDVSELMIPEIHSLCVDYGVKRYAYFSTDFDMLGRLMKVIRQCRFQIDRGYFTRFDDALHFLTEEKQADKKAGVF